MALVRSSHREKNYLWHSSNWSQGAHPDGQMLALHSPVEGLVAFTVQEPGRQNGQRYFWMSYRNMDRSIFMQSKSWDKKVLTVMTSGRLTMFITSVHVLVQASIVRGKQLEKLNLNLRSFQWYEVEEFGWIQRTSRKLCNPSLYISVDILWYFCNLTVEIRRDETLFFLGRAVVEEQPFALSKRVERLRICRGDQKSEEDGCFYILTTWHKSMHASILSTWNLSDGKKSSQS